MLKVSQRFLISCLGVFCLASCATAKEQALGIEESGNHAYIEGIELDYKNAFFDDFANGLDRKSWYICKSAWGKNNGGVLPDNVMYTDDGVLVLRGNGLHYSQGELHGIGDRKDGSNTGGVIISTFTVGPGHYEAKFKPLPRIGACTALWTYANKFIEDEDHSPNHEIDIEMPGGKNTSQKATFKCCLFTNWTKTKVYDSTDVILAQKTNNKVVDLNDGEYHVFGFDWYTNPTCVVYYIDGVITRISSSKTFCPTMTGRLWIGNWFPESFVGTANFETDYMLVDYVSYIPFKNQPYDAYVPDVTTEIARDNEYPTTPVTLPIVNKLSNGDFEYFDRLDVQKGYGWIFDTLNDETKPVNEVCYLEKGVGSLGTVGAVIKDGGLLMSEIDSIYEGMTYRLKYKAQSTSSNTIMSIEYLNAGETIISQKDYPITTTTLTEYTQEFTAPKGTNKIVVNVYNNQGESQTTIVDDFVLNKV